MHSDGFHCAAGLAAVNGFLDSTSLQDCRRTNPFDDDDDVGSMLIMFILSKDLTPMDLYFMPALSPRHKSLDSADIMRLFCFWS